MKLKNQGFNLLRELVTYVNDHEIPRENIINILIFQEKFFLLYYGD